MYKRQPDLYVLGSSQMEKAALAGLTNQLDDKQMADTYSEEAVHAVTYDGKVMAYPFYIETIVLLYNRYYADEAPATIDAILDLSLIHICIQPGTSCCPCLSWLPW